MMASIEDRLRALNTLVTCDGFKVYKRELAPKLRELLCAIMPDMAQRSSQDSIEANRDKDLYAKVDKELRKAEAEC